MKLEPSYVEYRPEVSTEDYSGMIVLLIIPSSFQLAPATHPGTQLICYRTGTVASTFLE